MPRIVLSTMGSLGDLHPMIALGLELRGRGHEVVINTWTGYEEKVSALGLEFRPLRPDVDPTDKELTARAMDARTGPEVVIKELIFPALRNMYDDLVAACDGADLMINGEVVFAAGSVAETTGIKWISTSLAPMSMFSAYDPNVYPTAQWIEYLRPLPVAFHRGLFQLLRWTISDWYKPFAAFRRELGLREDIDPIFTDKYSKLLHLAMFSRALGRTQPDWFSPTLQTGFCFYDESDSDELPAEIRQFFDAGEPPIVFTLGSAAALDAGNFFEESIAAANALGRRALVLYGRDQARPSSTGGDVAGYEFAPYSAVFPRAACVVHQGGVGTTGQALKAGVPQIIVPFSHDQPDNAARCRRAGVAEAMDRDAYNAASAAATLKLVLGDSRYREAAVSLKRIVDSETGTQTACDAIEDVLRK